jgi:uncharacterized protein YehS (DUF1456 family)
VFFVSFVSLCEKIINMLSNNDILKKLRVALSLKNDDIIEILALTDFKITKGALGDLFRHPDHEGYEEAGNQILRHFLNGLIIYKRGKLEVPKEGVRDEDDEKVEVKKPNLKNKK